jgi:hypothetical protein
MFCGTSYKNPHSIPRYSLHLDYEYPGILRGMSVPQNIVMNLTNVMKCNFNQHVLSSVP